MFEAEKGFPRITIPHPTEKTIGRCIMKDLSRRRMIQVGGVGLFGVLSGPAFETYSFAAEGDSESTSASPPWGKYEIEKIEDPNNMTTSEKKHQPVIELVGDVKPGEIFMARFKVGEIDHVMTPKHLIDWIEIYCDDQLVSRVEFTAFAPKAHVELPLKTENSVTLTAVESCNLHGIWAAHHKIEV